MKAISLALIIGGIKISNFMEMMKFAVISLPVELISSIILGQFILQR